MHVISISAGCSMLFLHLTPSALSLVQFTAWPLDVPLSSAWRQLMLRCDWCASEPSVHDLSLQTRSSSIMSQGASLSLYPNRKTFLYSSASSPPLLILLTFSTFSPTIPLPSIKVSLYCLYERIGVVNRCRVIGSILAAQTGRGSGAPPLPHTLTPATLF